MSEDLAKIQALQLALQKVSSTGTTLVSYYIPADGSLSQVSQHITHELGTASNIKSKSTRKDVQGALRSIQDHFRRIKAIPANGLAIFASTESYV